MDASRRFFGAARKIPRWTPPVAKVVAPIFGTGFRPRLLKAPDHTRKFFAPASASRICRIKSAAVFLNGGFPVKRNGCGGSGIFSAPAAVARHGVCACNTSCRGISSHQLPDDPPPEKLPPPPENPPPDELPLRHDQPLEAPPLR